MKIKILLVLVITSLTLLACENNETQKTVKNNEKQEIEEKIGVKENKESFEEKEINKTEESRKDNLVEMEKPNKENDHSHEIDHQHKELSPDALKAEDIIVTYFNAITLGDIKAINKTNPTAIEENGQLSKLFDSSKVVADIVGMKKVFLNEKQAEYMVSVKIYTKESDTNFTNNKSDYRLLLDLQNKVIKSKAITNTEYLE